MYFQSRGVNWRNAIKGKESGNFSRNLTRGDSLDACTDEIWSVQESLEQVKSAGIERKEGLTVCNNEISCFWCRTCAGDTRDAWVQRRIEMSSKLSSNLKDKWSNLDFTIKAISQGKVQKLLHLQLSQLLIYMY